MNIFVSGPHWMGQWTEVAVDALQQLGHHVSVFHHNRRGFVDHVRNRLRAVPGAIRAIPPWHEVAATRLRRMMADAPNGGWDVLLSIQGRHDADQLAALRREHPRLRILYWIGDPVPADEWPIIQHAELIDRFLIFSEGIIDQFRARGIERVTYCPFGISPTLHTTGPITERDRTRFTSDVSFVGTYNPQRAELLRHLNRHLDQPVRIWGRGWRHARGLRGLGRLTMRQSLIVHACSRIALNFHAPRTDGGLNIRFYEIPAAGGFQITDHQSAIARSSVSDLIASFRTPDELVEHVCHYLANEQDRRELACAIQRIMMEHETAERRFREMFRTLETDAKTQA